MIKKIVIDKFKSINHLEITPAGNFNVLIGENNIGKTTIFEAIHLWKRETTLGSDPMKYI